MDFYYTPDGDWKSRKRTEKLNVRVSPSEQKLLMQLMAEEKRMNGWSRFSQADMIFFALKHLLQAIESENKKENL